LKVYADSSFVVSLYITDLHSPEARRRIQGGPPLILTPFHRAEWAHALAQHQFRGTLTAGMARQMDARLMSDQAAGLFQETTLPDRAFELCAGTHCRTLLDFRRPPGQTGEGDRAESSVNRRLRTAKQYGAHTESCRGNYSSSSFTSPRSAFAFSMIFSCCWPGTTS
jgi:hypothetical protein